MIGVRFTDQMQLDSVINSFQLNQQALETAQRRVTTGKNITQPSDDPFIASQAVLFRQRIGSNDQLQKNLDQARGWLDATDTSLGSLTGILQRARQLSIQVSNDTYTAQDRKNAANEIHQLLLNAVDIANSKFGGQYLFSGTKTLIQPFSHDGSAQSPNVSGGSRPPVTYGGDNFAVMRQTEQAAQLQVNVTGDKLLGVLNNLAQLEYDFSNSIVRNSGSISGLKPTSNVTTGVSGQNVDTFSINGVPIGTSQTLTSGPLAGKTVTGFAPGTTVATVVAQINTQSSATGVTASIDQNGVLVLQQSSASTHQIVVGMVDQVAQDSSGNDLTSGSGVPVSTGGNTKRDLGLSNTIDNAIGSVDIATLDADIDAVTAQRAQMGAKANRVEQAQSRLSSLGITLTQLQSNIEDVDMAKAISDLASRQTAFQAALGVAAKTLPPSLLDFLR
jgi:flagellar hook-associated protein 3 FlgL